MSDLILNEFQDDLDRVLGQLDLIEHVRAFSAQEAPALVPENGAQLPSEFEKCACNVLEIAKSVHGSLTILEGTLVLYIAGRFEDYIRTAFEDLCDELIGRLGAFTALPKAMQESLVKKTAAVMLEPRKYGHAENGVRSFVRNLAENFAGQDGVQQKINSQCLSITEANMRSDVLADLFKQIGVTNLWKYIGQQAGMLGHFHTVDAGNAEAAAKKQLNDLMDDRNRVAHPSGSAMWPSAASVRNYVHFLKCLASSISALIPVWQGSLGSDPQAAVQNGA